MVTVSSLLSTAAASAAINSPKSPHAAIVGGSLGGLAAAHALSQTGWKVDVLERSTTPLRHKGSGLGFVHVPLWESLTGRPMIRRNQRASRQQGSYYYGDLWGYLYDGLDSDRVKVQFGKTISGIEGTLQEPVIDGISYDMVVLADGGFSQLRNLVFQEICSDDSGSNNNTNEMPQPEYAGYVVWRGSIAASQLSAKFLQEIQYLEGVYKNGHHDVIVLKMAQDNGDDYWTFGTFVATPEEDLSTKIGWNKLVNGRARHVPTNNDGDTTNKSTTTTNKPDWFLPHMQQHFSHIPHLVKLVEHVMNQGELQPHPQYEFGNIDKVHKGRILILGDAAHMASPRTASGAHTAILDAYALRQAMANHMGGNDENKYAIDAALEEYSCDGVAHAQQLYARSREVSQDFVPR